MMKRTARMIALTVSLFVLAGFASISAQTINEAGDKFNLGVEQVKAENLDAAIASFEECVAICDKLGAEGVELRQRAASQIPDLHYRAGLALYKDKKIMESIVRLEKAVMVSEQYGDMETKAKANKLIPQLYYAVAMSYYKKDDYQKTIDNCDKAISADPEYAKAYLGKAYAYNKMDNDDALREAIALTIEKGQASNDEKTIASAQDLGYKAFLGKGQKAIQASDFKSAEANLGQAAGFSDTDANLHYLLAVTFNKLSKWDDALAEARKAIELEAAPDKISDYSFEMGKAYENKGDTENACASYQKALSGTNGAAAKYQMEQVLKCQ